ncbi:MAG: Arc family DNA-binding protein [Alphaproteobacteria bacterium]
MATLTIRNLPDEVRDRLRVRAAQNGRSMEEEARSLLDRAVRPITAEQMAAVERLKGIGRTRPGFDPSRSAADEVIAERRAEAARENEKNGSR